MTRLRGYRRGGGKYHAKKTQVDGITFDSQREAVRYRELKFMEKAGVIKDLELQKKFELIPTQREPDAVGKRGGVKKGRVIEQACTYIADFAYHEDGKLVIEDVKSKVTKTPQYRIKKKLMLYRYGIRIREVE